MKEDKTKYKSFEMIEKINLPIKSGGELTIEMKVNSARTFRIEYFLNGKLIKPKPFSGKTKAYRAWTELMSELFGVNLNFNKNEKTQEENNE